ncbi:MAG: fructoselysine 6-kinase [Oscillospiraceae bacterium]|nr:fructoselysine 6-kinase [Oscillospiraceae bacterium]
MKKVVAVGDNCVDEYPKLGRHYPTGNCVDFAINIAKYGVETAVVTLTGTDAYGQEIVDVLAKYNVDNSHVYRMEGITGVATMDFVGDNDRTYVGSFPGVFENFDLKEEDFDFIAKYDIVHAVIWGRINQHLERIKKMGKEIVYDFATDLDDPEIEKALPYVDHAFFSYSEDNEYIRNYIKEAQAKGPKVVIATLGEHGSMAYDGKEYYLQPALPVKVVNTVGAGDSFISGYTYGLIQGEDVAGRLRTGAETSVKIIAMFDPY